MRSEPAALRFYRGLLCLYPVEYRDHFAREMCLMLADRIREQRHAAGVWKIWMEAAIGVLTYAPREHYYMLSQEIAYAFRTMRREKLFTFIAVLVLALGIGSTSTVFSLANGLLIRPMPYPDPQRLMYVEESRPGELSNAIAYPNYLDFRAFNRTLDDIAMFGSGLATIRGEGDAERVPAGFSTEPLFRVLGVQPMLGRVFTADEDRLDAPQVVILGEDLWRRRYGGDVSMIGKTITVGSSPTRVIGIMPRGFHFPDTAQLWMPLQLDPKFNTRADHGLEGIARLHHDATPQQAEADLRGIMAQITKEHPSETYNQTVNVMRYPGNVTRPLRPVVWTLLGAVGFVLLIACANIANLLLVKASARVREIAIRGALGASRGRLIRQLVVESLMLGALGAIAGLALTFGAVPGLLKLTPASRPQWMSFSVDGRVLLFTLAVTIAASILAGIVPAVTASRARPVDALKEGGRTGTAGRGSTWFRSSMVVAQIALSLLLLVGAGLMIRSFLSLVNQNVGFSTENLTTFQASPPSARYPNGPKGVQLVRRTLDELQSIPGVISVAASSGVPLADAWGRSLTVEGSPLLSLKDAPLVNHSVVTPGYFKTLGITITEGRDFNATDGKNPMVTIVESRVAKQYWPGQSALGKRIRFGPPDSNEPWHTVIGVSGEVRNQSLKTPRRPSVYLPYGEFEWSSLAYLVRTDAKLQNAGPSIRGRIAAIDRDIAVSRLLTMQEIIGQSVWQDKFFAVLFAAFAILALVLAAVGLYGVIAYNVSRRTHELGIRMALGASASELRNMVMRQSGRLVLFGVVLGTAGAAALTRLLLATQLYQVSPNDPATFAVVSIVLVTAAIAASYIPARRATRVDPVLALREE